jgi:hypothetical protein
MGWRRGVLYRRERGKMPREYYDEMPKNSKPVSVWLG